MFLSPLFAFDLRPFLCALCNPENLKLNLSRTMSLVITHEIKWTRIPVTGFFFLLLQFLKIVFIRSVAVCLSLSLPLRLVLSASVWLSLLNGWHAACCCYCCGQEALKMNSKTVDAGKLKTELSRLLFALCRFISCYFFFASQFVLLARFPTVFWRDELCRMLFACRPRLGATLSTFGWTVVAPESVQWPVAFGTGHQPNWKPINIVCTLKRETGNSQLATVSPLCRPFMLIN